MLFFTDADRREAESIAEDYNNRIPEPEVEALLTARGLFPGCLVVTDDGGKGFASKWEYDGYFNPVIRVRLVVPGDRHDSDHDWYSPEELTPYWAKR